MSLITNPWIVGIGGGIVSGLVVTLITRYLFSRRDNREYLQRIVTANQEILHAVRPGLSEGVLPSTGVLESLIKATAEKYGVDHRDLYQSADLVDVLTKEVMDTSFLSAKAKEEFCERLADLAPERPAPAEESLEPSHPKSLSEIARYRKSAVQMMSMLLGVVAALMTTVIVLIGPVDTFPTISGDSSLFALVPTLLVVAVSVVAAYATLLMRVIDRRRERRRLEEVETMIWRESAPDE